MIFPISASQVARFTGINHQNLAERCFLKSKNKARYRGRDLGGLQFEDSPGGGRE
jgi:hypothetical protein